MQSPLRLVTTHTRTPVSLTHHTCLENGGFPTKKAAHTSKGARPSQSDKKDAFASDKKSFVTQQSVNAVVQSKTNLLDARRPLHSQSDTLGALASDKTGASSFATQRPTSCSSPRKGISGMTNGTPLFGVTSDDVTPHAQPMSNPAIARPSLFPTSTPCDGFTIQHLNTRYEQTRRAIIVRNGKHAGNEAVE